MAPAQPRGRTALAQPPKEQSAVPPATPAETHHWLPPANRAGLMSCMSAIISRHHANDLRPRLPGAAFPARASPRKSAVSVATNEMN
jgi:hypothetical protein